MCIRDRGYVVADIGTDHGYIPIYLTKNGNCPRAYAMDVNKEPLSQMCIRDRDCC